MTHKHLELLDLQKLAALDTCTVFKRHRAPQRPLAQRRLYLRRDPVPLSGPSSDGGLRGHGTHPDGFAPHGPPLLLRPPRLVGVRRFPCRPKSLGAGRCRPQDRSRIAAGGDPRQHRAGFKVRRLRDQRRGSRLAAYQGSGLPGVFGQRVSLAFLRAYHRIRGTRWKSAD